MNQNDIERIIQEEQSRIESERERLLQGFHRLYEAYDPSAGKPFDISELMHEQYVARKQAQLWDGLEGDGYPEEVEEMLKLGVVKVPELKEMRSVVAYGPGSGRNTALIYNFFNSEKENKKGNLYLIDLSYEILRKARKYCENKGILFANIPWINPHFFQEIGNIPTITEDHYYKFHELLGQTLGNFKDPVKILQRITLNARKGEYMLLGWFDHGPEAYQEKKFQDMNRLLFEGLGYQQEAFGDYNAHSEIDSEGREWNVMAFTIQPVGEEKRKSDSLEAKYSDAHVLRPGTDLIVARSRRFKEEEVIGLCRKAGLEAVVFEERPEGYVGGDGLVSQITTIMDKIKWIEREDRRYGLFKQIKELKSDDNSILNIYSIIFGLGLLLAGFFGGRYLYSPDLNDVDCDKLTETNTSITCQYNTCLKYEEPTVFLHGSREPELVLPHCKERRTNEKTIMKSEIKRRTVIGDYVIYETSKGIKYKAKIE